MVFKCQEDSFLKEFTSKVVSCVKRQTRKLSNSGEEVADTYEVIFEDTVLFPEGGGQPCDHGFLNGIPVTKVIRKEDKAIHVIEKPLTVGEDVKQVIDWERRFDHMQQHSGQHLVTAIIDREFKLPTVSWWLGEEVCHVELDGPSFAPENIQKAENIMNSLIRDAKNVTVKVFAEDSKEDLEEARSARGLPADHKGDIRVINIEDVEGNMCCGTHVTNLSQLQVIKLLHTEKSKRKGKILLYFLVGNRVLKRLENCIKREQQLTVLLKNNPSQHPELVDKLQKNYKVVKKNLQSVLKDLAVLEANKLKDALPPPAYCCLHRKEAEPDFMNVFIKEVGGTEILLFLSTGDDKGEGNIVLYGDEKIVAELSPKISEVLEGKGAHSGNKYQAKVTKIKNRHKVHDIIAKYFRPVL